MGAILLLHYHKGRQLLAEALDLTNNKMINTRYPQSAFGGYVDQWGAMACRASQKGFQ